MKILNLEVHTKEPAGFSPRVQIAACYLQTGNQFLFLQKAEGKLEPGTWGVPAGKIEKNESPKEGAIRELFEETGISLKDAASLHYLDCLYIRKPEVDYVYHLFKVQLTEMPFIQLSNEHQDYRWATADELGMLPLMAGAKEAFQYYRSLTVNYPSLKGEAWRETNKTKLNRESGNQPATL